MRSSQPVLPGWLTYMISVAFVFSGIAVVVFAYFTFRVMLNRPLNPLEESVAAVAGVDLSLGQSGPSNVPTLVPGQPTPTLIPTSEPWAGEDRVNILLMGIDRRPGEAFISRTDTMMLVSLDPATETASILSIPRDLYVLIPGHGRDRINTAFVYGSAGNNPVGGAALAMQTVEYNLGVPVNHYVLVDFTAVINGINALGGIDVNVPVAINDPTYPDMNYGFDPLFIPAGLNHFDGAMALKYARTRHQDNDFGRAARQQQVILAVRQKAAALGFTGLVAQAGTLYQQVENGIRTDLSLEQMIRLATAANSIDSEDIRNDVLDFDYVSSHRTETGAQVLILENDKAAVLIQELFYSE
ncbi:LCP family protein [Candidatus Leptofilum sp.]|uniref:LCP family protein n=1 Tax=Candidatus Leptofilum sp. TaxID=3241576 RepID=UPI003B5CC00B